MRRAAATHQAPAATAVVPSLGHGEGHVAGGHHAVLEHEVWSPGVRLSMLSYDCEIGMIFWSICQLYCTSACLYVCLSVCIALYLYCLVVLYCISIVLYCIVLYVYVYGLCIFMACTYKASVWCSTSCTCLMSSGYQTGWISATKCRNWVRNNGWLGQRNSTGQPKFASIGRKKCFRSEIRMNWVRHSVKFGQNRTWLGQHHGWCCSQQFLVIILIIWMGFQCGHHL